MLAPHELKNKEFTKSIRGYNPQEVDEHIDFLLEKYTEAYRENGELDRKLRVVAAKLDQIKDDEESIRSTLVNAQKAGEKIIRDANDRADAIVNRIKDRCDEVLAEFKKEYAKEVDNLWEIRTKIIDFKQKVYSLYGVHLQELRDLSVNEITDIIIPDINKVSDEIVADVSEEYKREYTENAGCAADSSFEAADEPEAPAEPQAAANAEPAADQDDTDVKTFEEANGDAAAESGASEGSDNIDDFIKLLEDKANE